MSDNTIFLREIERGDLPTINAWRSDKALVSLLGGAFRYVGAEIDNRWFDSYLGSRAANVRLAVCLASTQELVGVTYLLDIDWVHRCAEFSIQIGTQTARGRGIGEAATRQTLDHAFGDLNLNRISLTVLASNARAIALYEKVGFRAEGLLRQAAFKGGRYLDVVPMAILADDRR
ncbi:MULTISPECIES: GNAT family N-acetyltransferase [Paraburkholderia]|uniref:UDP-4-amino-4, 6-dideoxy-N-acetyl-beta-L-altrosamine N-acetyltransferase n=1 Tax=Paraburkholderia dioscoreae TaxID=2604047 RepID=A0A5Q4Z8Y2_9BURK|nr:MULTISPECIES: GNAT family protein [Paraburkholderia]MDR8397789.1 GNAT family N-acetyltransferase [Paraburkholderia sp. USG1]VVD30709.1 UDP-4-amino-4, 6-dideoxy-N-acetyl-beta-L-altrosamine N-acetyltransferase [Paraburkholderia dioscoreae]